MRYLKGTPDLGICFSRSSKLDVNEFSDFDWANDTKYSRGTSGYVFKVDGTAITWCSGKLSAVSSFICASVYVSLSSACTEAFWLHQFFMGIGGSCRNAITIFRDSQSAIELFGNVGIHHCNKHAEETYH